jgi:ribulose-phosphate 3-epimerase
MYKIAPSILSANFVRLEEEIKKVEGIKGVQYLHIDVMDGSFVPNITIGAPVVKAIKKVTNLPLDVHLMIENPEKHIDSFIDAGADNLTVHLEATRHPERLLSQIRSRGISAGVSINPATGIEAVKYLYGSFDLILIMTVNPGFGGQKLIASTLNKVSLLKKEKEENKLNFIIEVDGGVSKENISKYVHAGAELIVAGNAVFSSKDPAMAIKELLEAR